MGDRISLIPNDSSFSTLSRASERGYLVVVQCLIGRGADVNESIDDENVGYTPLHGASYGGHMDVVRELSWQQGQMWVQGMVMAILHCMVPPAEGTWMW